MPQGFEPFLLKGQSRVGQCQEQDEPEMGQAEWGNDRAGVLQNIPERSLCPLSRTLIMVTLAWTPANF